jgi:hypothetical protein
MNIAMLIVVFLSAILVSAGVVVAFSVPIDGALSQVLSPEMASPWSRFVKFALFVASLTGGLRLHEITALSALGPSAAGNISVTLSECLIEVFKTVTGCLGMSAWTLLAFFCATLAAYAVVEGYEHYKSESKQARSNERHTGAPTGRY